jgi:hypothetical protein
LPYYAPISKRIIDDGLEFSWTVAVQLLAAFFTLNCVLYVVAEVVAGESK